MTDAREQVRNAHDGVRAGRDGGAVAEVEELVAAADVVNQVDSVTGALEGLAAALGGAEELPVVLRRCAEQVVHAIPDADHAGITLLQEGDPERPYTVAATAELVLALDQAQYDGHTGPCLTAANTGQMVRATLSDAATSWPRFAEAAGSAGINSVLSAPLYLNEAYQGSLNLYGGAEHGYHQLDVALLELYTTAAEAALGAELRHRAAAENTTQLRTALSSRAVIDQAKGIIMAARQIDADAAFAVLAKQSQQQNRKLRDVAEEFVRSVTEPR
jgi:hypothetical protein